MAELLGPTPHESPIGPASISYGSSKHGSEPRQPDAAKTLTLNDPFTGGPVELEDPDLNLPTQMVVLSHNSQTTEERNVCSFVLELMGGTTSSKVGINQCGRFELSKETKQGQLADQLQRTWNLSGNNSYSLFLRPGLHQVMFDSPTLGHPVEIVCYLKTELNIQSGHYNDTIILGTNHPDQGVLVEFYDHAQKRYHDDNTIKLVRISSSNGRVNTTVKHIPHRDLSTVYMAPDIINQVVADLNRFFNNPEIYSNLGLPRKYNLLLYGLPGTGKSSLVKALASHFRLEVGIITLSAGMTDTDLQNCYRIIQKNDICLFEDFDRLFDEETKQSKNLIGLSTILNLLDGVETSDAITIVTANNHEQFDPAIRRRFDRIIEFGLMTEEQIRTMFAKFFPLQQDDADELIRRVQKKKMTPAMLQTFFWQHYEVPQIINCLPDLDQVIQDYNLVNRKDRHRDEMYC